jgi:hypothetical protein
MNKQRELTFDGNNLFGLIEISNMTLVVNSAPEVTCACAEPGPSRDQTEVDLVSVERGGADIEGCRDISKLDVHHTARDTHCQRSREGCRG